MARHASPITVHRLWDCIQQVEDESVALDLEKMIPIANKLYNMKKGK